MLDATANFASVGVMRTRRSGAARLALGSIFLLALVLLCVGRAEAAGRSAVEVRVDGVINPVKARLVARAVARAEQQGAELLLLTIDTPGGLVVSMQQIVTSLTNTRVPVVAFVEPRSAQATSAGAFILLAADVAAMAPGTRLGAAHPVADGKSLDAVMDKKATSTLAALARSLAERRGRPAPLAEAMVRESASYTAEDALEKKLVEVLAVNRAGLLTLLDGREVRPGHKLSTRGLTRDIVAPTRVDRLLDQLAEPTLASLFLSLGGLAILYELTSPGIGVGGLAGAMLLVLGLLASSALALETTAVVLLVTGFVGILLEVKVPAHGLLAGVGAVALVLGAVLLVDSDSYFGAIPRIQLGFVVPILLTSGLGLGLLMRVTRRALAAPVATGPEALVGRLGQSRSDFGSALGSSTGQVFVDGARWQARTEDAEIHAGESIQVVAVEARPTRLFVRLAGDESSNKE
jgi:membrane-bound serine protease (ClpP class)